MVLSGIVGLQVVFPLTPHSLNVYCFPVWIASFICGYYCLFIDNTKHSGNEQSQKLENKYKIRYIWVNELTLNENFYAICCICFKLSSERKVKPVSLGEASDCRIVCVESCHKNTQKIRAVRSFMTIFIRVPASFWANFNRSYGELRKGFYFPVLCIVILG